MQFINHSKSSIIALDTFVTSTIFVKDHFEKNCVLFAKFVDDVNDSNFESTKTFHNAIKVRFATAMTRR